MKKQVHMTRRRVFVTMILVAVSAVGNIVALVGSLNNVKAQGDPGGSHFRSATYFEDLRVEETVGHRQFTVQEIMEMIDRQPNVRTVALSIDPPRPFSIDTLAYPQYAYRYEITSAEWADLQAYCRDKLRNPIAADEVINHWRSIARGVPPFGLRVQGGAK